MTTRVVIVQRVLPHYRVPFYEQLRDRLHEYGVDLSVVYGQEHRTESSKNDQARLDWATPIHNRYWNIGSRYLCWQPLWAHTRSADLIVMDHASRLLANYGLMLRHAFGGPRLAFWGHVKNLDENSASRAGEALKRQLIRHVDWWFCYTEGMARAAKDLGVRPDRLTVVQNATDTTSLRRWSSEIDKVELDQLRRAMGIGDGPVAVALGSLYSLKRPGFLLAAADRLAATVPGFHLVVIGDGPDRTLLDVAAQSRSWLHVVGTKHGKEMVRYALLGSVMLNPGAVGLSVLDAFAIGLPLVTCDITGHGPEVEYLKHGINGLLLPAATTPDEYADAVGNLLLEPSQVNPLVQGCHEAAGRYTIEEMAERFADGAQEALARPRQTS